MKLHGKQTTDNRQRQHVRPLGLLPGDRGPGPGTTWQGTGLATQQPGGVFGCTGLRNPAALAVLGCVFGLPAPGVCVRIAP